MPRIRPQVSLDIVQVVLSEFGPNADHGLDRITLRNCSLTSQAWCPLSRSILFQDIEFTPFPPPQASSSSRYRVILKLASLPDFVSDALRLQPFLSRLRIEWEGSTQSRDGDNAMICLSQMSLPNLRILSLANVLMHDSYLAAVARLMRRSPILCEVHLVESSFETLKQFTELISGAPALSRIHIDSLQVVDTANSDANLPSGSPKICVHVGYCPDLGIVLRWLSRNVSHLKWVDFCMDELLGGPTCTGWTDFKSLSSDVAHRANSIVLAFNLGDSMRTSLAVL
jgi:hypothetical protein